MAYDANGLYIAIECDEPDIAKTKGLAKDGDGAIAAVNRFVEVILHG